MVGQVRGLRRLEHHHRRRRRAAHRCQRHPPRQGPQIRAGRPQNRGRAAAPPRHRHCRIRPRHAAAGWCRARRCWSAAIPASASPPSSCRRWANMPRRGGHAIYISGEEAMAQVRMRAARMGLSDAPLDAGRRHQCRRHSGHPGSRQAARHRRHRFHPDLVDRRAGCRARHHRPGAHRQLRSGALCQVHPARR